MLARVVQLVFSDVVEGNVSCLSPSSGSVEVSDTRPIFRNSVRLHHNIPEISHFEGKECHSMGITPFELVG